MTPSIRELIENKRVIVCCGAGGVGKTTTATAIALAAARHGRRVLALTVDPSRRLAETLGVERNLLVPTKPPQAKLDAAGIKEPGLLETWMLDPQLIAEQSVRRLAKNEQALKTLTNNRIYKELSRMVAGMQEYTAMEALHQFINGGKYDLVVLDTPPARNALDFLEGPSKLARFLDGRIFRLFLPDESGGMFQRGAAKLLGRVLSAVFGEETYKELQEFFAHFSDIFGSVNVNASATKDLLSDPELSAFLLVTSPSPEALKDAFYFYQRTQEMSLPFRAFVLNRSEAVAGGRQLPTPELLGSNPDPFLNSALIKLQKLAQLEFSQAGKDWELLSELNTKAGENGVAIALPTITSGANDMPSLLTLAQFMMVGVPLGHLAFLCLCKHGSAGPLKS
jgi:anion-transporting  ArsA/GET3 family ATPase